MEFQGYKSISADIAPTLTAHDGRGGEPCVWILEYESNMNEEAKVEQVGNLIPDREGMFHNSHRGRVYSTEGIAPCMHTCGGGNLEPKILLDMENPKSCASRQRGDRHKLETRKDDVANCVTSIDTDSMVAEPQVIGSMQKNAYKGSVEGVAPCITAMAGSGGGNVPMLQEPTDPTFLRYGFGHGAQGANKDMAYAVKASAFEANNFIVEGEPKMVQKVGDRGTDNYSINEISNTIPANPMSDRGQVLVEPKIVGYSRDSKGKIVGHHLKDVANVVTTFTGHGHNTDQYVAEADKGGIDYKGKFIKEGDGCLCDTTDNPNYIRGGLDGVSRTIKAEHPDAGTCIREGTRYRIRKLTEREVFRLMDVSEEDIDKIQAAGISKTAQYKLAGNSIVVSCLYHIFRKMFVQTECETQQLSLF